VIPVNGVIDEVALWSRGLTNSEIAALYNSGSGLELPLPVVQGASYTYTFGLPISSVQGASYTYTFGDAIPVSGSATFHLVRGELAPASNRGSTTFQSTRDAPIITNGLIRGPQFRLNTIGADRFNNRLTSVLSTISPVHLTDTGTTTLYTVPTGNLALIQGVIIRSILGPATTDATISLGINPSTTNLFDLQQLVNVRTINDIFSLWSDRSTTLVAQEGDQIDLDVTIAATGGSMNVTVYLIGFLI
jgi:hypothetical protein